MSIVYPSTVLLISPIVFVFLITNDNVSNKYFESNELLFSFENEFKISKMLFSLLFSLVITSHAVSSLIILKNCRSCPCYPLLLHAMFYLFLLSGLSCHMLWNLDTLGNLLLSLSLVTTLAIFVTSSRYGAFAFLLTFPLLLWNLYLFRFLETSQKNEDGTCSLSCGSEFIVS